MVPITTRGRLPPALDVWLVDVLGAGRALDQMERCEPRLVPEERERTGAAADSAARAARRTCRIALRLLIERYAGPDLARRPFAYSAAGKPHMPGTSLHFTVSHRQGVALIALCHGERIGVDVEAERRLALSEPRRAGLKAAAAAMAPFQPLPAANVAGTLQAWTRLEAAAKASGDGIGRLLTELGLRGRRGSVSGADVDRRVCSWLDAAELDVADLVLPRGLFGALAVRGARALVTPLRFPTELRDLAALTYVGTGAFERLTAPADPGKKRVAGA